MRVLAAAAVLATLVASPGLAQSFDPDPGTGNVVQRNDTTRQTNSVPARSHGGFSRVAPGGAASPLYLSVTPFDSSAGSGNRGNHRNTDREKALRECSSLSRRYSETTWGGMATHQHRNCMAQHGQME